MESKQPSVLSIAGSDSSAGAGIQADIKMCSAIGVHCATVITSITAQNTLGVSEVFNLPAVQVKAQLRAILDDLSIKAIKVGMLGSADNVIAVADVLSEYPNIPLILDPVLISSSGKDLLCSKGKRQLITSLLPMTHLLTPNLDEAAALLDVSKAKNIAQMAEQAALLRKLGPAHVLIKGGHSESTLITDLLNSSDVTRAFEHPRIESPNTHGTGCNLSSAIAAFVVLGHDWPSAIDQAIDKTCEAIRLAATQKLGSGNGPLQAKWHSNENI